MGIKPPLNIFGTAISFSLELPLLSAIGASAGAKGYTEKLKFALTNPIIR